MIKYLLKKYSLALGNNDLSCMHWHLILWQLQKNYFIYLQYFVIITLVELLELVF